MEVLILSCGTGGGHDAAAEAIREELERRGDRATVLNPYTLRGGDRARQIDRCYISLVQKAPWAFGLVYGLGELYRRLPWRSPVYLFNHKAAVDLRQYLVRHPADAIIATHVFPAEILTQMKNQGIDLPATLFVATDYACIPFTEETDCDAYVIPATDLTEDFRRRGIPEEKLVPLGIPVRRDFTVSTSRSAAREALGLDPEKRCLLLSGGSIGAGKLRRAVKRFDRRRDADTQLIVICGNNERLYRKLERRYGSRLTLLRHTSRMALYLRACDLYLTKPGGLCSTEAAVMGVPLVHLPPIPGCETINARYFRSHGMSLRFRCGSGEADRLLARLDDPALWRDMAASQRRTVSADAAAGICRLVRDMLSQPAAGAGREV